VSWTLALDHLPALPELLLLVGTCTLMIADARARDPRRPIGYWMAQGTLGACFLATLFVIWGTGVQAVDGAARYDRLYLFNGLFVADFLAHLVKLASYAAVSAA